MEKDRFCIAHVGLDNIHVGDHAVNYDLRQDLRICVAPYAGRKYVELEARGAADWHVLCFVGRPQNIPGLEPGSLNTSGMLANLTDSHGTAMTDAEESYKLMALGSLPFGSSSS